MTTVAATTEVPGRLRVATPQVIAWPTAALVLLAAGMVARLTLGDHVARVVWTTGLVACAVPVVLETLRDARRGRFATDIVATMAIVTALLLGSPVAGLVVVLMKRGGEALERYAEGRASEAVRLLEEAAPRIAHRMVDGVAVDVTAGAVRVGDTLLVRPGELVPCDGIVTEGESDLDTSSLTGEPMPVSVRVGVAIMSGSANGAGPFSMRVTAPADRSQYARIVSLVRTAQSHKAPMQRMADRFAVWFTPATLLVCAVTLATSGDWMRVLAVLVVATPCPLILATPVAFVGGINRAARRHIVVRHGGALERLARANVAVLDKTGTITLGEPRLSEVRAVEGWTSDEVLRLAASLESGSSHRLARIVTAAAADRGLLTSPATAQSERPGQGISGLVSGREVHVGSRQFVLAECTHDTSELALLEGESVALRSYVGVDGRLVGVIDYAEELRADLATLLRTMRGGSIHRILLLSGDHEANVRRLAARAGIDEVRGDLLPADKSRIVAELVHEGHTVLMVGDGTNDAPALAAASVGVALAGHGGGITAEAADVIILRDSLAAVADSLAIGSRTTRIARQSIWVGLGLSAVAMLWAAAGGIAPVPGALLQEAIDVAVILNALRALREGS